jgi:Domain of unknown function (DUF4249)
MKKIITMIIASMTLVACEKEIELDLNSADPQIVIEGAINNLAGPYYVKITRTNNFSDKSEYTGISNALVIISDDMGVTDTLTEISPGLYETNTVAGFPEHKYSLNVTVEGKNYSAQSTIPQPVVLDSLRFGVFAAPGAGNDNLTTTPIYTDPIEIGNNYRFLLKVNGESEPSYTLFNDNVNNGQPNIRPIGGPGQQLEILAGDTVEVEMRCLDVNVYNYFYTLSAISGAGPGGGTTPTNPPSNITGENVLGFFSANTSQTVVQIAD